MDIRGGPDTVGGSTLIAGRRGVTIHYSLLSVISNCTHRYSGIAAVKLAQVQPGEGGGGVGTSEGGRAALQVWMG